MMEHILMEENGTTRAPKNQGRKWAAFVAISLVFVLSTVGGIYHFEHKSNGSSLTHLAAEMEEMCDACNAIPGFDEYQTCKSCWFHAEEDKALTCSTGYGDLKISNVKHGSGRDFALIAESCEDQEQEFDYSSGEAFTCNINLAELRMMEETGGENEYFDEYTGAEGADSGAEAGAETDPNAEVEPVLSQYGPGPHDHYGPEGHHHHHHHHHHDEMKIEYVCSKHDQEEPVPFKLRSTRLLEPQTDEPFLSSALMHCGKTKTLADTVQVSKYCGADNFELTCDANGVDPRIIILKFKQSGKPHSHSNKKAGKARAKLVTNACVGSGASCSFTPDDFVTESENAADFAGKNFEIKYLCSYGAALPVETPAEPHMCCKALTPSCMACTEGITEAEYCGRPENAEICGRQLRLGSQFEAPSDLLLESANVKCGGLKASSNTVDFGKACSDSSFELTCDNTRTGSRIVVLKFKDTGMEKPTDKASKKAAKKAMKARAAAATDLCDAQRDSSSCTFDLSDVVDATTDLDSLVDHVFNVKYLCSYD